MANGTDAHDPSLGYAAGGIRDYIVEMVSPSGTSRTYHYIKDTGGAADAKLKARQQAEQNWNMAQAVQVTESDGSVIGGAVDIIRRNSNVAGGFAEQYPVLHAGDADADVLTRVQAGAQSTVGRNEFTPGGAQTPGDPEVREELLPSVAFQRALDSIGMGSGVGRGIATRMRDPLANLAQIGIAAGLQGNQNFPLFNDFREGAALQDFYERVLPSQVGRPGQRFDLRDQARMMFDLNDPNTALGAFQDPAWGAQAGASGLGGFSGNQAAQMMAELGLTGYGRGRFGALSRYLPTADQLVTEYGAQPVGDAEDDFRRFIRQRLTGVSR